MAKPLQKVTVFQAATLIPEETKEEIKAIIELSGSSFQMASEDLVLLFQTFNNYLAGNGGKMDITCRNCRAQVVRTFKRIVEAWQNT